MFSSPVTSSKTNVSDPSSCPKEAQLQRLPTGALLSFPSRSFTTAENSMTTNVFSSYYVLSLFLMKEQVRQADRMKAGGEPDTTVGDKEMTLLSAPLLWAAAMLVAEVVHRLLLRYRHEAVTQIWTALPLLSTLDNERCNRAHRTLSVCSFCEAQKLNKSRKSLNSFLLTHWPGKVFKTQNLSYQQSCLMSDNLIISPTSEEDWARRFSPRANSGEWKLDQTKAS